jgi:hypothetical protein
MKAVLTCDDIFDVLTRAPFPAGNSEDEIVESHLAVCHDCRQLAEALRPAVGLFHEAIQEEADDALPAYRGELAPLLMNDRSCTISPNPQARRPSLRLLTALAACLVIAVFSATALLSGGNGRLGDASVTSTAMAPDDRNLTLLTALELPSDCKTRDVSTIAVATYQCCTKCHHANSRNSSSRRTIVKSSAACVACHDRISQQVSLSAPSIFAQRLERL